CVFYKRQCTYNPQMVKRDTPRVDKRSGRIFKGDGEQIYGTFERSYGEFTHKYPTDIIVKSKKRMACATNLKRSTTAQARVCGCLSGMTSFEVYWTNTTKERRRQGEKGV